MLLYRNCTAVRRQFKEMVIINKYLELKLVSLDTKTLGALKVAPCIKTSSGILFGLDAMHHLLRILHVTPDPICSCNHISNENINCMNLISQDLADLGCS